MTHSKPLFKKLEILNVYQLHQLCICCFMYELVNGTLPHSIIEYCSFIQHKYRTRQREKHNLYIPKVKTTKGKFSISYKGSSLRNNLPLELRTGSSSSCFRKALVEHLELGTINRYIFYIQFFIHLWSYQKFVMQLCFYMFFLFIQINIWIEYFI